MFDITVTKGGIRRETVTEPVACVRSVAEEDVIAIVGTVTGIVTSGGSVARGAVAREGSVAKETIASGGLVARGSFAIGGSVAWGTVAKRGSVTDKGICNPPFMGGNPRWMINFVTS